MRSADARRAAERAGRGFWIFRAPPTARALRDATDAWGGPGLVALTDRHLIFDGAGRRRQTSLGTIVAVEQAGDAVWIQRRRAHDWLLYLTGEQEARRVWNVLADRIDRRA